jgi:hypothetical protein
LAGVGAAACLSVDVSMALVLELCLQVYLLEAQISYSEE